MLALVGSVGLLERAKSDRDHLRMLRPRGPDVDLWGPMDEVQRVIRVLPDVTEARPFGEGRYYMARTGRSVVEFEVAWPDSAAEELVSLLQQDQRTLTLDKGIFGTWLVPALDVLYMLKMTHRYKKDSPHFRKTMADIRTMRRMGAQFDPGYADWYQRRERETYTNQLPKLNVMKRDFFRGDGVQYVYDHDDIHQTMAHHGSGQPAYRLYMKDGAQVQCDRHKFEELPELVRLWGVLEEVQVLALERSQIPYRGKADPRYSFDKAHEKVCTSITGGWFREFAWENYERVQGMYEPDYVERFWSAVDAGHVRRHQQEG